VGPSTGLPTRTSQGDLSFIYNLGHGDTDFIILIPGNVNECYEFGWRALDLAEKYQTPVIVISDLELGMNEWICDEFKFPDEEINRGKILWEEDIEKNVNSGKKWGRYLDTDGDGIPHRTVPGNMHAEASYFARGTGHDEFAHYSEDPQNWQENLDRLKQKYMSAVKEIPNPVSIKSKQSNFGIISFGSTDLAIQEVLHLLKQNNSDMDYLRVRGIPFDKSIENYLKTHEKIFVVEANRDGQMKNILCANFPACANKLISVSKVDGLSLSAEWIYESIKENFEED
jgi:2-oxoglutarate ferredoxin oxidoreductase subunit alpha